jgi:hypothetical protein
MQDGSRSVIRRAWACKERDLKTSLAPQVASSARIFLKDEVHLTSPLLCKIRRGILVDGHTEKLPELHSGIYLLVLDWQGDRHLWERGNRYYQEPTKNMANYPALHDCLR